MSADQGTILLAIARAAISTALGRPCNADESAPWLTEPGASFVTLTQNGQLRGCIGSLEPRRPLLIDIKSNAVSAALHDTRFMPMSADELDGTDIEVSLLSLPAPVKFIDEADLQKKLRPGIDGVIFECNGYRSTFLPQIWRQLPRAAQFMAHLKRKAGFPDDFWDENVKISRYSVVTFSEKHTEAREQKHG